MEVPQIMQNVLYIYIRIYSIETLGFWGSPFKETSILLVCHKCLGKLERPHRAMPRIWCAMYGCCNHLKQVFFRMQAFVFYNCLIFMKHFFAFWVCVSAVCLSSATNWYIYIQNGFLGWSMQSPALQRPKASGKNQNLLRLRFGLEIAMSFIPRSIVLNVESPFLLFKSLISNMLNMF